MNSFSDLRAWIAERQTHLHRADERRWRLPQRLDLILVGILLLTAGGMMLAGSATAILQATTGLFDPPAIAPVPDERLTANLRSAESEAFGSFTAADYVADENALYLLRARGRMHRLDVSTGLWSDDDALTRLPDIHGPFFNLSLGCPNVEAVDAGACDGEALFAYSQGGGIALRQNGAWRVIISESSFVGLSGKPISNAQLTLAAVSTNGRWLLVAAGTEGFGLFDLTDRRWVPVSKALQSQIFAGAPEAPTALVAHGNEFLVGTRQGLVVLAVNGRGEMEGVTRLATPTGEVLDLAAGYGELLVLARTACEGGSCLLLGSYANGNVQPIQQEGALYPSLASTSVSRAIVSADASRIYVLGTAGVYVYLRTQRNWEQLLPSPASAFLEGPAIDGIYFATPGGVGHLSRGGVLRGWPVPGTVTSLATDTKGRVLAQTLDNATYALEAEPRRLVAGKAFPQPLDRLQRAVGAFGQVVALSDDALLLHDLRKRSYVQQPLAALSPREAFSPAANLIGTPEYLWSVNGPSINAFGLATADGSDPQLVAVASGSFGAAPQALHANANGLLGVMPDGAAVAANIAGDSVLVRPLFGPALPAGSPIIDAQLRNGRLLLARAGRVDLYLEGTRGIEPPITMPIDEPILEIAAGNSGLLMLSRGGSVVVPGKTSPLTGSLTWMHVGSSQISDALAYGSAALMAGPGGVTAYDLAARRTVGIVRTGSGPRTKLAGMVDGLPVSYDGNGAWYGEEPLRVGSARVVTANVVSGGILTTQVEGDTTFLVEHRAAGNGLAEPVCYFRSPGPLAPDLIDVAQLADGRSVVLSGAGLWLRDEAHRRYVNFTIAPAALPADTRLTVTGTHLIAAGSRQAFLVPLATLAFLDSCSTAPVTLTRSVIALDADHLAVSTANQSVRMLDASGAVSTWSGGTTTIELAAPTLSPDPRRFVAADQAGQTLHFADPNAIWRYSGATRLWEQSALKAGTPPLDRVDIWNAGSEILVTARDGDGVYWGGATGDTASTSLTQLRQADFAPLPFPPRDLIDVSTLPDQTLAFLGRGELALVPEPSAARPRFQVPLPFPSDRDDRSLFVQNGHVAVIEGAATAPDAVYVLIDGETPGFLSFAPEPGERFEIDRRGGVVRALADGRVFRCPPIPGPVSLSQCVASVPRALTIRPDAIAQAFEFSSERLLVRDPAGTVTLLNRAERSNVAVASGVDPIVAALRFNDGALLLDERRRLRAAMLDGQSGVVADDVRMIRGDSNLALIQTGAGLMGVAVDGSLSDAELLAALGGRLPDQASLDILSLTAAGAAGAIETPDGLRLLDLTRGRPARSDDILSLPGGSVVPPEPLQAVPVDSGDWLLRYPDRMLLIGRTTCLPSPPPLPPVETQGDPTDDIIAGQVEQPADAPVEAEPPTEPAPSVEAVPPAEPVACLVVKAVYSTPTGRHLHVEGASGDLVRADGRDLRVRDCREESFDYADTAELPRRAARYCTLAFDGVSEVAVALEMQGLREARQALVNRIDAASGQLDPTTLQSSGSDFAVMVGDIETARHDGNLGRTVAPAVDLGWMGWRRDGRSFMFRDSGGQALTVQPQDAMPGGRFAFAAQGTAVMTSARSYMVANAHGVWRYAVGTRTPSSWTPMALPEFGRPARGRVFFDDRRSVGPDDTAPQSVPTGNQLTLGMLQVDADSFDQRVEAIWSDGMQRFAAFAGDGFQFDHRLDIVADGPRAWLRTPVGLVDTVDLGRSAPLPTLPAFDLLTRGDVAYASGGGQWAELVSGGWSASVDPDRNRTVANEGHLTWSFVNGALEVSATDGRHDLAARNALRFDADVLRTAAMGSGGLVFVLGDSATRQATGLSLLADPPVPVGGAPAGADHLDVRRLPDGSRQVVAIAPGGAIASMWTGSGYAVLPAANDPDIARAAAEMDWLRVRFDAGAPVVELALETAASGSLWSPISWAANEPMPFDRITAVHQTGSQVLAGSPVALQIWTLNNDSIATQRFIDMRASGTGPYDPVRRIGLPLASGAVIHALGGSNCLQVSASALSRCSDMDALDVEDLGGDSLWQWLRADNEIGQYYLDNQGGQLTPATLAPQSGRFAHDALDDIIVCGGVTLQSWNGNLTQLSGEADLRNAVSVAVTQGSPLALHCQSQGVPKTGSDPAGLDAGLYAIGSGSAWRWNLPGPDEQPEHYTSLRQRAAGGIAVEAGKLRVLSGKGVAFQYRRGDQWETLVADGGRLAIDHRDALVFAEGGFWAHTRQGLVSVDGASGGLDPDRVVLAPVSAKDVCRLDAAEVADGRVSHLPVPSAGATTVVRCDDGQLLAGPLDPGSEFRTFAPLAGADPFEGRVIYEDEVARVQMIGRTVGRPGNLSFTWRWEENALSGGRFALDDYQSLARIEAGTLDFVTGLGWVRQRRDDLSDSGATRPPNRSAEAREVTAIAADAGVGRQSGDDAGDETSLCLTSATRRTLARWQADGTYAAGAGCAKLLAFDGSYAYRPAGGGGLAITGNSENGPLLSRELIDGRFSDHRVTGSAVLAQLGGESVVAMATGDDQISRFDPATGRQGRGWAWPGDARSLGATSAGGVAIVSIDGIGLPGGGANNSCPGFSERASLIENADLRGLAVAGDHAWLRLMFGGSISEFRINCQPPSLWYPGDQAAVQKRLRFIANADAWGRPTPQVVVSFVNGRLEAEMQGRALDLGVAVPSLHFSRVLGNRFIYVSDDQVYQSDIDALMGTVQARGVRR